MAFRTNLFTVTAKVPHRVALSLLYPHLSAPLHPSLTALHLLGLRVRLLQPPFCFWKAPPPSPGKLPGTLLLSAIYHLLRAAPCPQDGSGPFALSSPEPVSFTGFTVLAALVPLHKVCDDGGLSACPTQRTNSPAFAHQVAGQG